MTELIPILQQIEQHLSRIADAASLKVKRAQSAEKTTERKRLIADTDRPTEGHMALAKRIGVDIAMEWPKFKAYCQAHNAKYASFEAAFRKWLLNNRKGLS